MIKVYTDGACKGNPGDGGWGALIINGSENKELYGGEKNTTNNRMELMAVIMAIESIDRIQDVTIFTDSTYVQKGISEWIINWKRNGWKSSNKQPVKNQDLWVRLDSLNSEQITWQWVKGHSGHIENDRADYLANLGVHSSSQQS
ncbi:ribonuclease HI [Methylophilaceae bacterium]|jgi:ribonuclease HI|uniref:Ribonuclease H n=1 Tax=Methylophilales bacterium HTCC2181 TaxID=383631 RepID=A0P6R5_9PROT|nr:Ribonuclease H [Methylophilales bacterium HTCC2181]MBT5411600.1 ribonuclease HI [Nitrosomonadales bacterium]MCH9781955.1 ribonuclease HI [Betaproteobacteria bacterium]MDA9085598.1 ribonuclease HI [Methylophilaceae bacterium]MCH9842542.1 ribonuclease HI [Betaproteobacteria bacterium]